MAFSSMDSYWIKSEPVQVHFLGWRGDTVTLQRHGWQFSMEQDLHRQEMVMCMQHDAADLFGFTNRMTMRHTTSAQLRSIVLDVPYMACRKNVTIMGDLISNCVPVDCEPVLMEHKPKTLEDFQLFTTVPLARTQEIIVDPADVNQMMDLIHKAQLSKQKEIRRRREGEEVSAMPKMNFHAQIMSIEDAA